MSYQSSTAEPSALPIAPRAATMQAVVADRYGSAEVVAVREVARPTVGAGEVLVEVAAAGIDRGVWHLLTGQPYLLRLMGFGVLRPKQPILGMDVAGRVVQVGAAVTRVQPGDAVFGIARGAFAQYAVASADKLVHTPDNLTVQQAAVSAISGITAVQALEDVARVQPGQSVLVIGASGGVGTFAVQLAVALGARVTGVASTAKLALVRSLGADAVVDYTATDALSTGATYDVVLAIGGRDGVARLRRALTPTGTLVIVGGDGRWIGVGRQLRALLWSPFVRQRLTTFISTEHHSMIQRLAVHMASGAVAPVIDRTVSLAEIPGALRALEAGRVTGKIAVAVGVAS